MRALRADLESTWQVSSRTAKQNEQQVDQVRAQWKKVVEDHVSLLSKDLETMWMPKVSLGAGVHEGTGPWLAHAVRRSRSAEDAVDGRPPRTGCDASGASGTVVQLCNTPHCTLYRFPRLDTINPRAVEDVAVAASQPPPPLCTRVPSIPPQSLRAIAFAAPSEGVDLERSEEPRVALLAPDPELEGGRRRGCVARGSVAGAIRGGRLGPPRPRDPLPCVPGLPAEPVARLEVACLLCARAAPRP